MPLQKSSGIRAGLVLGVLALAATADGATPWTCRTGDYALSWDLHADVAQLVQTSTGRSVWRGPLLPGFWLQVPGGERRFVKAEVDQASIAPGPAGGTLGLRLPGMGGGTLRFSVEPWGIQFHELRVTWDGTPPAILGLYFGSAPLTEEQRTVVPSLELPFWPGWSAEGYCVPSGKGGPVQSFFRNWDLGHATFPLGSFGPSLAKRHVVFVGATLVAVTLDGQLVIRKIL